MIGLVCRIGRSLANIASGGMDLLFPPQCTYCQADITEPLDNIMLCSDCCSRLVPDRWIGCRHCGGAILEGCEDSDGCSMCREPPLLFDTVVAVGGYHNLQDAILRMKRPLHAPLAVALGRVLALKRLDQLAALQADTIVPIPMYWARRMKRGSNSPEILADCLRKKLGIPVRHRLLVRSKNTLPQVGLSPKQRFRNMRGAFRVRSSRPLQGARILLVDDVLTTGATGSEAAKMLKKAGASMVAVAVVARAQGGE
jgi:ComF family protein